MIRTYVTSFDQTGYPLSLSFAALFSKDALTLALSDGVLVASTGLSVPFVKLMVNGSIPYTPVGVAIQHLYQGLMLGVAVKWTFDRRWEWVQSGFFTLHALVMLMKVHSYVSINGRFSQLFHKKQEQTKRLEVLVNALPGGRSKAEIDARDARKLKEMESTAAMSTATTLGGDEKLLKVPSGAATPSSAHGDTTPAGTPKPIPNGIYVGTETVDGDLAALGLRNRLAQMAAAGGGTQTATVPVGDSTPGSFRLDRGSSSFSATPAESRSKSQPTEGSYFPSSKTTDFPPQTVDSDPAVPSERHPLIGHPDSTISTLAQSISDIDDELTSTGVNGKGRMRFPENVTLWNFCDYQLIPTLVYELEYPRTDKVRISYVFEKTVAFVGTFTLLYTIAEHYIIPMTPTPDQSFLRSMLDLALPFMLSYLLLFYIIFECICNGFAEISRFADRQFYEDWWNSTSWDEFARKWNKPVHSFLLRHVYASSISDYKFSKPSAALITFLLSALLHELVMAIVTKKIRMYLFMMQMAQVPLIALGRIPVIRRNKILGNVVFWFGLMTGFPLLCVAYCAY